MRLHRSLAVLAAALVVIGCGSTGPTTASPSASPSGAAPTILPIVVSSELGVGENRLVFVIVNRDNVAVSAPDRSAAVAFAPPGSSTAGAALAGTFLWGIEGVRGYYVVHPAFDQAGQWTAFFTTAAPGQPEERVTVPVTVQDRTSAVRIGQPAPSVDTPTLADVDGKVDRLSTDAQPNLDFYRVSEADALAGHRPFALVFATPAFCTSALCGPQLDKVKELAAAYPGVTFINVEPYRLQYVDGRLQPLLDANNQLQSVPAVDAFGIRSEPWLYVVDGDGIVRGSFEGVFAPDELRAALDQAT